MVFITKVAEVMTTHILLPLCQPALGKRAVRSEALRAVLQFCF